MRPCQPFPRRTVTRLPIAHGRRPTGNGLGGQGTALRDAATRKRGNVWIWVSAALAIAAVGLLIWGLKTQSDLDNAQQDVAQLQSQAAQSKDTGGAVLAASKSGYDELSQQLGATNEDLAATQQDLKSAEQAAAQADKDAAAAQQDAAAAKNDTDKAKAQAEQAQAEQQAAESKLQIATDCAKAYFSAFGALFEGKNVGDQADAVKKDLQGITDTCRSALSGA